MLAPRSSAAALPTSSPHRRQTWLGLKLGLRLGLGLGLANPNPNPNPNQAQELQQAQEMRRRQIEAAVAQARQQLVSTNADHARIMGMNVNANPALARKRDDKVREILAKRAKIESVIEQLLEKLPPGERGA